MNELRMGHMSPPKYKELTLPSIPDEYYLFEPEEM